MSIPEQTSLADRPAIRTESTHLPGDSHMWVMVLGDLAIFGAYFLIYMVHRAMRPDDFLAAQQHLDVTLGVVNTGLLLTSSLLVARSVYAARGNRPIRAMRLTYAAGACGVLFLAVKAYEWSVELGRGLTVSNEFFSFYYVLTGVHALHVVLGLIILGVSIRELRAVARRRVSLVEQGATYWHMVDLLWIVIFGLLYVMR
ncbi:cytochrome C oxidase subunit III [Mycobacterium sp. IS-1590]|uniref:cytochrome c oxidase subunit 3 n=1 Tax=Mycobacterium sp. IS-1590 TaxID=1772286 RepID=UPI00074AC244|nr:cytochrome c oxidase subunit 3 [Mycobacterium sp. IS-1590]KUI44166.1 cytochrome C oxidase subunit III [Mycobacterium sp. IS-1590]